MHRLSSQQILRRYRIVSFLILVMFLLVPVSVAVLGYGVYAKDIDIMRKAGMIFGGVLFLKIFTYLASGKLKCPLCMGVPLRNLGCTKHRSATKLLGSYQAEVAVAVLFKDKFRCPYCGERTAMQVRERRRPDEAK